MKINNRDSVYLRKDFKNDKVKILCCVFIIYLICIYCHDEYGLIATGYYSIIASASEEYVDITRGVEKYRRCTAGKIFICV